MGYRIEYDLKTGQYEVSKDNPWQVPALTIVCFGIFLLLSSWFWPEGIDFIRDLVIPGEDAVTIQAFQNMTQQLHNGISFRDALSAFCLEVMRGEASLH